MPVKTDLFPVFCGRFIVLEDHVPEQIIESRKDYDIGFFEQEVNRFQAYVLASADHVLMNGYRTKYLGSRLTLLDDRGNSTTAKIQNIVLMGTFCPHFGTHAEWQAQLDQSSDKKAAKQIIAQEMWKKSGTGGVFIVGVTDSDLKSNNVFAGMISDKATDVFRGKRIPYEMRSLIKAAFDKTDAAKSLAEFMQKEKENIKKGKIENDDRISGIEGGGREFIFYFADAWVNDGENPPWNSANFRTGYCWEFRGNKLIPVNNLNVTHLEGKIFFNANNNNIPDFYTVDLLRYFYFCIDGQIKKKISIPYYDCGM
ncbi:MAG: hypothetical protein JW864_07540 [Spirochaetes bacterium]|nr:hypothetical protein [Spirochaetota bacterium]